MSCLRECRRLDYRRLRLSVGAVAWSVAISLTGGEAMVTRDETISRNGSTRATAYAMSCKVITAGNTTFVAWLDHVADIQVRSLNRETGVWSETVLVGKGVDNHSGPAITMDSRGHLHIVYGPHHGPFNFQTTQRPHDVSAWSPVEEVGVFATYPSLVCGPDDTLHLTYRGGDMPRRLMYQRRPKGGNWSDPVEVVDSKAPSGYTQYGNALAVDAANTLHLVFHIYDRHPAGGKAAGYLTSTDAGRTWQTAEGVRVALPATPGTPCFFAQSPELDMRTSNVALSPQGRPFVFTSHLKQRPPGATLWSHDGTAWRRRDLLPEISKAFPERAVAMHGTLTFDTSGRLYLAIVTGSPSGGGWGSPSWEAALLVSDDQGQTFETCALADANPQVPAWLLNVERPYSHRPIDTPMLLYTRGGPGKGCTGGDCTTVHAVTLRDPEE
ncbi:MAG: hypothetical protein HN742_13000 [Lentisphaerae bacterium]|nr:hypothetical protein [Lentisphaerota bacterium]MBT7054941.1 hypothetical protein [Lentisphaerota bacterium]MBT7842788.1 hypothetical protein [Lentisphaerota bacterium]